MEDKALDMFLYENGYYEEVEKTIVPLVDVSLLESPERIISGKAETLGKLPDELKKYFGAWYLAYKKAINGEAGVIVSFRQLFIDSLDPYPDKKQSLQTERVHKTWLCIAANRLFWEKVKQHFHLKDTDDVTICLNWLVVRKNNN